MAADPADENEEVQDAPGGLGEQLVQRAAAPGVIRRDLAARIQRSCCVAETGLATEIQRRFSPGASPDPWGQGPALPYAGFGGFGGAASGGPMPGLPAVQAKPMSSMPVARAVGGPATSPAAQTLSSLGSSLQQRHLGATQSGGEMIQRRALPGSPSGSIGSIARSSPVESPGAAQSPMPIVQRQTAAAAAAAPPAASSPSPVLAGPAIVRRSPGSSAAPDLPLRRMSEPEDEEKPVESGPAPPTPTVQASVARKEMGPAIVHRSAGRSAVQRASAAPAPTPATGQIQRAVSPDIPAAGAGTALPLAQPSRPETAAPTAATPVQRSTVPGSPASALPLVQAARPAGRGDAKASVVQASRMAASTATSAVPAAGTVLPAPAAGALSTAAAGLSLPLARSAQPAGGGSGAAGGGVVQRQTGGDSGMSMPATEPPGGTGPEASAPPATADGAAGASGLDLDDVVEHVMRRLTRSLAVESERHGGRRWP